MSEEEIAQLAAAKLTEEMPHNRLWYRINAVRTLGGGHKLQPQLSEHLTEVSDLTTQITVIWYYETRLFNKWLYL